MINPINYASGLVSEVKAGAKERATAAKAELVKVVDSLRAFDVDHLGEEAKSLKAAVLAEVESILPKAKK